MKKEISYFTIDGAVGGSQDWFTNVVMHIGGCAAAAACDTCIFFAEQYGNAGWYPFDEKRLSRKDYLAFSQMMKPYIKPRVGGVKNPEWYIEGFGRYLKEHPYAGRPALSMEVLPGSAKEEEAEECIRRQIDRGYPVPVLLLKHENTEIFQDFIWHWFMIIGYEENACGFSVITATYGEKTDFLLRDLWNTGYEEKGGLILYRLEKKEEK